MCSGAAKAALNEAIAYASGRRQFGRPIASFGAIRHKLAEMTIRIYAVESMLYRVASMLEAAHGAGADGRALAAALEELAVEASLLKVASSEAADYVVDENVQIHGGNGFVADYPAERRYRDARVNRIFEGTNEINRLVVPAQIIKRARAGALPLSGVADAWAADRRRESAWDAAAVPALKRLAVQLLESAVTWKGDAIENEQELLMLVSDVILDAFAAESVVMRASAAAASRHPAAALHADAAAVFVHDAALRAGAAAHTAREAMTDPSLPVSRSDEPLDPPAVNTIAARRRLADAAIDVSRYIFSLT
jgi:hypothetical protein